MNHKAQHLRLTAKLTAWIYLLTCLCAVPLCLPVQAWDGTADTSWFSSDETEYHIDSEEALAGLAVLVNEGEDFYGKTVCLDRSLSLNDTTDYESWAESPPAFNWTPIGASENTVFAGTFEGGYHTISGLYIDTENEIAGLFGAAAGAIRNLRLTQCYVHAENTFTAGLCAITISRISNCLVDGTIIGTRFVGGIAGICGSTIEGCGVHGTIRGSSYVGGICGDIGFGTADSIRNSYNQADVSGTRYVGGLTGLSYETASFENAYSAGRITGNLCGALFGAAQVMPTCENLFYSDIAGEVTPIGNLTEENPGILSAPDEVMKEQGFEQMLGEDFVYTPGGYPILAWMTVEPVQTTTTATATTALSTTASSVPVATASAAASSTSTKASSAPITTTPAESGTTHTTSTARTTTQPAQSAEKPLSFQINDWYVYPGDSYLNHLKDETDDYGLLFSVRSQDKDFDASTLGVVASLTLGEETCEILQFNEALIEEGEILPWFFSPGLNDSIASTSIAQFEHFYQYKTGSTTADPLYNTLGFAAVAKDNVGYDPTECDYLIRYCFDIADRETVEQTAQTYHMTLQEGIYEGKRVKYYEFPVTLPPQGLILNTEEGSFLQRYMYMNNNPLQSQECFGDYVGTLESGSVRVIMEEEMLPLQYTAEDWYVYPGDSLLTSDDPDYGYHIAVQKGDPDFDAATTGFTGAFLLGEATAEMLELNALLYEEDEIVIPTLAGMKNELNISDYAAYKFDGTADGTDAYRKFRFTCAGDNRTASFDPTVYDSIYTLCFDIPDRARVTEVAEQYHLTPYTGKYNGETVRYYLFPVYWAENGTELAYSGNHEVQIHRYEYRLANGSYTGSIEELIGLQNGSIRVMISDRTVALQSADQQGNALSGARYQITALDENGSFEGVSLNGRRQSGQQTTLSLTTDTIQLSGLPDGSYLIEETTAPDGYTKIAPVTITIRNQVITAVKSSGNAAKKAQSGTQLILYHTPCAIHLDLLDQDGNALSSADAVFRLSGDKVLSAQVQTAAGVNCAEETDGALLFSGNAVSLVGLPDGTYTLRQLSAPEQYSFEEADLYFTVREGVLSDAQTVTDGTKLVMYMDGPEQLIVVNTLRPVTTTAVQTTSTTASSATTITTTTTTTTATTTHKATTAKATTTKAATATTSSAHSTTVTHTTTTSTTRLTTSKTTTTKQTTTSARPTTAAGTSASTAATSTRPVTSTTTVRTTTGTTAQSTTSAAARTTTSTKTTAAQTTTAASTTTSVTTASATTASTATTTTSSTTTRPTVTTTAKPTSAPATTTQQTTTKPQTTSTSTTSSTRSTTTTQTERTTLTTSLTTTTTTAAHTTTAQSTAAPATSTTIQQTTTRMQTSSTSTTTVTRPRPADILYSTTSTTVTTTTHSASTSAGTTRTTTAATSHTTTARTTTVPQTTTAEQTTRTSQTTSTSTTTSATQTTTTTLTTTAAQTTSSQTVTLWQDQVGDIGWTLEDAQGTAYLHLYSANPDAAADSQIFNDPTHGIAAALEKTKDDPAVRFHTLIVDMDGIGQLGDLFSAYAPLTERLTIFDADLALQQITDHAFSPHTKLEKVVISESLQSIGACAFEGCTSLEQIGLRRAPVSGVTIYLDPAALRYKTWAERIQEEASAQIIPIAAPEMLPFENDDVLTAVQKWQITRIGENAFDQTAISHLLLPEHHIQLGENALGNTGERLIYGWAESDAQRYVQALYTAPLTHNPDGTYGDGTVRFMPVIESARISRLRGDIDLNGAVDTQDAYLALCCFSAQGSGADYDFTAGAKQLYAPAELAQMKQNALVNADQSIDTEDAYFILSYFSWAAAAGTLPDWTQILQTESGT